MSKSSVKALQVVELQEAAVKSELDGILKTFVDTCNRKKGSNDQAEWPPFIDEMLKFFVDAANGRFNGMDLSPQYSLNCALGVILCESLSECLAAIRSSTEILEQNEIIPLEDDDPFGKIPNFCAMLTRVLGNLTYGAEIKILRELNPGDPDLGDISRELAEAMYPDDEDEK